MYASDISRELAVAVMDATQDYRDKIDAALDKATRRMDENESDACHCGKKCRKCSCYPVQDPLFGSDEDPLDVNIRPGDYWFCPFCFERH